MAPPVTWTDQRIQAGLDQFFQEYGRYPTAVDFDKCPYLPTARQIQRRLGGLPEFRAKFLPDQPTDHTKGDVRSAVAKITKARSYVYEEEFYNFLINLFPEHLVHEQKRLRPGNIACDFFIYTSQKAGIAIDLFYAMDVHSLAGIIRIKLKRYGQLPIAQKVYFVSVINPHISQEAIDRIITKRKTVFPENISVVTEENFKREIELLAAGFEAAPL